MAGIRRIELDETAWLDYLPGWVAGQEVLLDELARSTRWEQPKQAMYDRLVDTPRLVASVPEDSPGHPLLDEMREALSAHYGTRFAHTSLALYRDGNDSVAWHGDRVARNMAEALVATVSLGEPRRFLLRPKKGGASRAFTLGWGDLSVMGGSCQRTWQHSIPKMAHAHPRLVVMFRPEWAENAAYEKW